MSRHKTMMEARTQVAESSAQTQLSDTLTNRDYEIILGILYGLFSWESAENVRVFDPFVADSQQAPLVTPRMLTQRIEALIAEHTNA